MPAALFLSRLIDRLNETLGRLVAWSIVAAILISAANAIARRALGVSSNGWLELQWYLFGAVFMLGSAWTLKVDEHIRIDVLSSRLSRRARGRLELFGHLFFLIPFVGLMLYLAVPFVTQSITSGEASPNPGGLPIWPAKALIGLGFVSLALQALSELIKRLALMRGLLQETAVGLQGAEAEAERLLQELAIPEDRGDAAAPPRH